MTKPNVRDSKRVYLRALHRISLIHEKISVGNFPSVGDLAKACDISERTIKRDLDLLHFEMKAPIVYERERKGFRYKEIGWSLPSYKITEGELLALFIAEQDLRLLGNTLEAVQLRASVGKLIARLPDEVSVNRSCSN